MSVVPAEWSRITGQYLQALAHTSRLLLRVACGFPAKQARQCAMCWQF
jgi:hypothetical protein